MPGPPKHIPDVRGKVRLEFLFSSIPMPATDLVPCFYTGQDYRWEKPAEMRLRSEVRDFKTRGLGKFVENGRVFLFSQKIVLFLAEHWNGKPGGGSILAFLKTRTDGTPLHYEIPHAGDRSIFARHHRSLIHVSSRNLFRHQAIPA